MGDIYLALGISRSTYYRYLKLNESTLKRCHLSQLPDQWPIWNNKLKRGQQGSSKAFLQFH